MGYYDDVLGFNPLAEVFQGNAARSEQQMQANLARREAFQKEQEERRARKQAELQQLQALTGPFGKQLMGELLAPATEPYNPQSAMPGTLKDYGMLKQPPMVGQPQAAPLDIAGLLKGAGIDAGPGSEKLTPEDLKLMGVNIPAAPMTQPPATQYVAPPPPPPKQMLAPQTLEELALMQQLMPHLVQRRGQQEASTRGLTGSQFRWNTGAADRAVKLLDMDYRQFMKLMELSSEERIAALRAKAASKKGAQDSLKEVLQLASQWNSHLNAVEKNLKDMQLAGLQNANPGTRDLALYEEQLKLWEQTRERSNYLNEVADTLMAQRSVPGAEVKQPKPKGAVPPPAPQKKIRVKWNGQPGTINEDEFDPNTMVKL